LRNDEKVQDKWTLEYRKREFKFLQLASIDQSVFIAIGWGFEES
jgi:hypothetical protein